MAFIYCFNMELNEIKQQGTWGKAVGAMNTNFAKINAAIVSLQDVTILNKGYFKTEEELANTHSKAVEGAKAYVGSSYPYAIYLWSHENNAWINSGEFGGEEELDLANYRTKEEQDAVDKGIVDTAITFTNNTAKALKNDVNNTIAATKEDIQADYDKKIEDVRDDFDNVMSEKAYQDLAEKEDKFYFICEEEEE